MSFGEHFSPSNHSPPYTLTEEKNDFRPSPYHCLMSIPLVLSSFLEKNYLHLMVRACKLVCTITMSTISITTCTMSTMSTTCTTSWLRACQLATLQGGMPTTSCHPATTAPASKQLPSLQWLNSIETQKTHFYRLLPFHFCSSILKQLQVFFSART